MMGPQVGLFAAVTLLTTILKTASGETNIALGKPAIQSSTYDDEYGAHVAGNAVDGSRDMALSSVSCSHTLSDKQAWWEVDLLNIYNLESVQITRRDLDGRVERLEDFTIEISVERKNISDLVNPRLCYHRHDAQPLGTTVRYTCIDTKNTVGRYVRIQLQTDVGYLTLCEVEMFGTLSPSGKTNIALGKPAIQSSTYVDRRGVHGAGNAVDGNSDMDLSGGSCSHTERDKQAWWEVDLLDIYNLESVQITRRNRKDLANRLKNFTIEISVERKNISHLVNPRLCFHRHDAQPPATTVRYTCIDGNTVGRYVRIQLQKDEGSLTLCEVEMFGTLSHGETTTTTTERPEAGPRPSTAVTSNGFFVRLIDDQGKKLKTEAQFSLESPSATTCAIDCTRRPPCSVVNYNKLRLTCKGYPSHEVLTDGGEHEDGWEIWVKV